MTGQLQTAELLDVSRIDVQRLIAAAQKNPADWQLQWGAAETLVEWPNKRAFFESALQASGTNIAIVARYALFAAQNRDREVALPWLHHLQKKETDNIVPWLAELWLLVRQPPGSPVPSDDIQKLHPAMWATNFRDYAASAARARVRLLEAAGYTPYSARRLAFMPDIPAPLCARDLMTTTVKEEAGRDILEKSARAMQTGAPFLLYEFIGQSLETALMQSKPLAGTGAEARLRSIELESRRDDLKALLARVEQNVIDIATEQEMVRYFDDVLTFGEENALRRLLTAAGR